MTIQRFECPSCLAPLDYDDSGAPTVSCPYCGTTVIVPDGLRRSAANVFGGHQHDDQTAVLIDIGRFLREGKKIEAIKVYRGATGMGLKESKEAVERLQRGEPVTMTQTAVYSAISETAVAPRRSSRGCTLFVAILVVLVGGLIPFFLLMPQGSGSILPVSVPVAGVSLLSRTAVIGGSEGTEPGSFDDTRFLGVDGEGLIYTADFDGGRVQVFNRDGEFISQWVTQSGGIISDLAVDRSGRVYILEGLDNIYQYDGQTGTLLQHYPAADLSLDSLAVRVDGSLLGVGRDGFVIYNGDGGILHTGTELFTMVDGVVTVRDVAVDEAYNFYVLPVFEQTIYKFDANGQLLDQIGQEGSGTGDFRSANALAIDKSGRILVDDFNGIIIFDSSGDNLELVTTSGVSFSMMVDDQNVLHRMDRNGNRIVLYEVAE